VITTDAEVVAMNDQREHEWRHAMKTPTFTELIDDCVRDLDEVPEAEIIDALLACVREEGLTMASYLGTPLGENFAGCNA
jgi:hypothetical protein